MSLSPTQDILLCGLCSTLLVSCFHISLSLVTFVQTNEVIILEA